MLTVSVFVGSACHKRGSYAVLKKIKALCSEHGVSDRVTVVPAFCLGACSNGISVKVGDRLVLGMSEAGADALFEKYIVPALGQDEG